MTFPERLRFALLLGSRSAAEVLRTSYRPIKNVDELIAALATHEEIDKELNLSVWLIMRAATDIYVSNVHVMERGELQVTLHDAAHLLELRKQPGHYSCLVAADRIKGIQALLDMPREDHNHHDVLWAAYIVWRAILGGSSNEPRRLLHKLISGLQGYSREDHARLVGFLSQDASHFLLGKHPQLNDIVGIVAG